MRKLYCLFSLVLVWNSIWAQQKLWTLEECVAYAREHNVSIQKTLLDENLASIDKKEALGNFLPTINASGSHSWTIGLNQNITTGLLENQTTQFTSAGLDVGIDIFKAGQNFTRKRRADLSILAARYQSEKIKDDVALNVVNAYLQVIFNKEHLRVNQSQLAYDLKQQERIQALVDAGAVPAGDLVDSKATAATTRQNVILAENNLKIAKLNLAQLLQIEDYEQFDVADETFEIEPSEVLLRNPKEIVENSKEVLQDYKILETQLDIARKDVQLAKSGYYPTIRGFYSFATRAAYADVVKGYEIDPNNPSAIGYVEGTNERVLAPRTIPVFGSPASLWDQFDFNKGHSFGLAVSIPILNGGAARNNVNRSKIAYEKAELSLKETSLQLEQKVYTAYTDTHGALQTFEAATLALEAREQSLEYAKQRYEVGLINIFDLNQNQNLYLAAQSEALRAKYDFIFKTKIVEYYFGMPIFKNN